MMQAGSRASVRSHNSIVERDRAHLGCAPGVVPGLVPGALSSDEFAELLLENWSRLRSVASGVLGCPDLAEDVLQEAALIALTKLDSFKTGTCFAAWMAQVVRFVALNYGRKQQKLKDKPVDPADLVRIVSDKTESRQGDTFDIHSKLSGDDQPFDDKMIAALNTLDELARVCLLLRTLHDMPYREISTTLDIPEGTAMSHVHRARRFLRDLLSDSSERTNLRGETS